MPTKQLLVVLQLAAEDVCAAQGESTEFSSKYQPNISLGVESEEPC